MATVRFTQNIQRHVACPEARVEARTVREALEAYFGGHAGARGYVLDDQGALRHHMVVFVDGRPLRDRVDLSDPLDSASEVYVLQALSGG